jgi:hypothetical protein
LDGRDGALDGWQHEMKMQQKGMEKKRQRRTNRKLRERGVEGGPVVAHMMMSDDVDDIDDGGDE